MTVVVHSGGAPGAQAAPRAAEVVVDECRMVADDVLVLTLRDPGGQRLPPWMPGAHVDVTGPTGIERQYSLCGPLDDRTRWDIAVLREPAGRGGSEALHAATRPGDRLRVAGPHNHFRLVAAERYLFVAGGIGITPLRAMVELVAAHGRPWALAYGGRRRAAMAFADELAGRGDAVRLHPADEGRRMDVTTLVGDASPGTAVYCCGPARLIDHVAACCARRPDLDLHLERFTPVMDRTAAVAGPAFRVHLARSGLDVAVAGGQSLLDALAGAGVVVASSCTEGVCGTCEVTVLAGTADHRDSILSAAERQSGAVIFACVSRAAGGDLVLDL